jgi:hypothetical protein
MKCPSSLVLIVLVGCGGSPFTFGTTEASDLVEAGDEAAVREAGASEEAQPLEAAPAMTTEGGLKDAAAQCTPIDTIIACPGNSITCPSGYPICADAYPLDSGMGPSWSCNAIPSGCAASCLEQLSCACVLADPKFMGCTQCQNVDGHLEIGCH